MRATLIFFGLLFSVSSPAFAQEWAPYQNIEDGFKVDFPGQPKVTTVTCPPRAEPCLGSDLAGVGYWKHDVVTNLRIFEF